MSDLRSLSRADLLSATLRLAAEERRITCTVLEHFREIERRKAYSDLGFKSLYEYAITHLKYSEGSASRRIAAMYALKENPELSAQIKSGETSVTSIAKIHSTIRRDEKLSARKWRPEEKKALYLETSSLTIRSLEKRLIEISPTAAFNEKIRLVSTDLHEVKIYLKADELAELEELRNRLGHSLKDPGSHSELFRKLIRFAADSMSPGNKRKVRSNLTKTEPFEKLRTASPPRGRIAKQIVAANLFSSVHPEADAGILPKPIVTRLTTHSRLSVANRRTVFERAGNRCEYRTVDGKRCDSRFRLEVEHRIPRALGGTNNIPNLEILCRDHNQIRGIQIFGADRMRRH